MRITPLDIRQKEFRTSFRGYNIKEVQDFLLELATDLEDMFNEYGFLKEEKEQNIAELRNYREFDQKLKDTLLAAQSFKDDLRANAEKEADLILKDARLQAEEIHRQTRIALEKLEKEIEELKSQKKSFRARLRSVLESHMNLLEEDASEAPIEEWEKLRPRNE